MRRLVRERMLKQLQAEKGDITFIRSPAPSRPAPVCPICQIGPMTITCGTDMIEIYLCATCETVLAAPPAKREDVTLPLVTPAAECG